MQEIQRRSFLQLAVVALPVTVLAPTANTIPTAKPVRVPAGSDREGKKHAIGVSSTTYELHAATAYFAQAAKEAHCRS